MKNVFGRKLHVGRLGVPLWSIAVAGLAIAAVAGQAVGPVLTGSVSGSAGVVVSQTVVLSAAPTNEAANAAFAFKGGTVAITAADDFAATVNDEGTLFSVALETQVGQNQVVNLALDNLSGKTANFILELSVPAGIDVEVDGVSQASNLARLNRNTWLGTVTAAATNTTVDVNILVESKDDAAPSFYTISGRIIQVAN